MQYRLCVLTDYAMFLHCLISPPFFYSFSSLTVPFRPIILGLHDSQGEDSCMEKVNSRFIQEKDLLGYTIIKRLLLLRPTCVIEGDLVLFLNVCPSVTVSRCACPFLLVSLLQSLCCFRLMKVTEAWISQLDFCPSFPHPAHCSPASNIRLVERESSSQHGETSLTNQCLLFGADCSSELFLPLWLSMCCNPTNCMSPLILFSGSGAVTYLHVIHFCVCIWEREQCYLSPFFRCHMDEFVISVMFSCFNTMVILHCCTGTILTIISIFKGTFHK